MTYANGDHVTAACFGVWIPAACVATTLYQSLFEVEGGYQTSATHV